MKAPLDTATDYDRYGAYQIPRIRGVFALHQLRLHLGNAAFARAMRAVQDRFSGRSASTQDILKALSEGADRDVAPILHPWLERADLPAPRIRVDVKKAGKGFAVRLAVEQQGPAYPFVASVNLETAKGARLERVEVQGARASFTFASSWLPTRVLFNAGNDLPLSRANFWVPGNLLDDWSTALLVYGTARELEAQRTLAASYRETLADHMTEVLLPLKAGAEVSDTELATKDLILFGGPAENGLAARLLAEGKLPLEAGSGWFRWQGRTYGRPDDGLLAAFPNPWNPKRMLVLLLANSRIQEWAMTRTIPRGLPGWALYRSNEVQQKGYFQPAGMDLALGQ